ncbi:MAG: hypothetical protein ACI3XM_04800 [Eubacteriales bacterium]
MHSVRKTLLGSVLLSALLLAACANDSADAPDPAVTTSALPNDASETDDGPQFPQVTFGGRDIHFLTELNKGFDSYSSHEIYSAGTDGSLINDTVFARNLKIEERFDVRITEERLENASTVAHQVILSGEDLYDVVMPYMNSSISNALLGLYRNLYDVENLHLESAWWDQRANENLRVGDCLYFTTGDISILDNECTMVLFFNKQLIAEHDLPDPYSLVRDGTWTLDQLFSMSAAVAADLDGDGKMTNKQDRFGLFAASNVPHSMFFGTGERIVKTDSDGTLTLVMNNERSAEIIPYILDCCLSDNVMRSSDFYETVSAFMENRLLFAGWALTDINYIRDCKFDFGILPYPKYEPEQNGYYSLISTGLVPGVSIPKTNAEPETAGLILEAMAYESVSTLTKAYYETALNNRYIRDEESGEMLDIIFASRVYDFGFINDIGGLGQMIGSLFGSKKTTFVSAYEAREKKALAALENLQTAFAEAEAANN